MPSFRSAPGIVKEAGRGRGHKKGLRGWEFLGALLVCPGGLMR